MKSILLTLLFIFQINICLADFRGIDFKEALFPYGGYSFGEKNTIDFGLGYGTRSISYNGVFNRDASIIHFIGKAGLEINPNQQLYVPKIAFEANFVFISARLSLMYEMTKQENNLKLYPEIGLCLGSYMNLMIQYTGLNDDYLPTFSSNKISLNINIPLKTNKKKQ